jgi:hypothetical protein
MKHQLKGALTLAAAVATCLGTVGGVASFSDHDRETFGQTLLAEAIVAAAWHLNAGAR